MADQQLNIRLNVIDNASKAFESLKGSVFNLRNALIGLGTGVALKSLIDIGRKAEDAKARLTSLTGSTVQGGKAFDQFTQFAIGARVPLEEVIASSKKLVALGSSPEKLAKNLEIISNISAQTGLGFETTVDQFSKATTKGLNNARLFADENIRILLGIPKGLEVGGSDALKFFEREFSGNGRFGKANQNLKAGVSGSIIALQNILFSFASQVSVGFFNVLKKQFGDLELFFKQNKTAINEFATTLGNVLGQALIVVGGALKIFVDNINLFIAIFVGTQIFKVIESIRKLAIAIGLLNVAFLTPIGVALGVIAGAFLLIYTNSEKATQGLKNFKKSIEDAKKADPYFFGFESEGLQNVLSGTDPIKKNMEEINSSFEDFLETGGTPLGETDSFLEKVLSKFNELNEISKDVSVSVAEGMNKAIGDFSKGIAESIVLGKSLQGTLKGVAQTILIDIISSQIKEIGILLTKLAVEKAILAVKTAQASVGGGGGSFFGSLLKIGASIIGGGANAGDAIYTDYGAEGGSFKAGMPITVGERGREIFVPQTNGNIIPNHDMGMGGMNITFNIQANDVRGIKELLIDNRATIINLVNQGANQKGKSNIV
jgi:methyl-accepting chemotaxis protein